jgi:hypothetical protein
MMFDAYHAQIGEGNPVEQLRRAGNHIGELQVADVPSRCESGAGKINYPDIARTLAQTGYTATRPLPLARFREGLTLRAGRHRGVCAAPCTRSPTRVVFTLTPPACTRRRLRTRPTGQQDDDDPLAPAPADGPDSLGHAPQPETHLEILVEPEPLVRAPPWLNELLNS